LVSSEGRCKYLREQVAAAFFMPLMFYARDNNMENFWWNAKKVVLLRPKLEESAFESDFFHLIESK